MPSRLDSEDLGSMPPSDDMDPYKVLDVATDATPEQIRSSYRRLALRWHPDKITDPSQADEAKLKFQEIALAYAVLSDERRRKRYDATGRTEESLEDDEDPFSWAEFYRAQFDAVISGDAIEEVRKEYQGSDEERQDVLDAYTAAKGDMDGVYETVMLSDIDVDDERFRTMIQSAIDDGEVEAYKKFTRESTKSKADRKKRAGAEAKEAEQMAEELGVKEKLFGGSSTKGKKKKDSGEDALKALIMQRQKGRADNFLADLEAKYAPKQKGKGAGKRAALNDEPPEEMFEKNRKKAQAASETSTRKSKRSKA